ncbi:MAG: hypothetical protein Q8O67_33525 [Deltaproteobacteria bacterium]|nr:hypothetical protein [Deltaproteobacteria bacterium]
MSVSLVVALALQLALPNTPNAGVAVRMYGELEYESAEPLFRAIATRPSEENNARASAWLWVGLCQAGVGNFAGAAEAMKEALKLDPDVAFTNEVSPTVQELFDDAKTAALKEAAGTKTRTTTTTTAADGAAGATEITTGEPEQPPVIAGPSPLLLAGGGVAAVGAAAALTGVVFGVIAQQQLAIVDDPQTFQDDAQRELDGANRSAAIGLTTGIVGGALIVGGVVLLVTGMSANEPAPTATVVAPTR